MKIKLNKKFILLNFFFYQHTIKIQISLLFLLLWKILLYQQESIDLKHLTVL
jgi:hypothetical protein